MNASILVCSGEPSWQETCQKTFTSAGYFVEVASDANVAMGLVARRYFHLALVDICDGPQNTSSDSLALLQRIRELGGMSAVARTGFLNPNVWTELQTTNIVSRLESKSFKIQSDMLNLLSKEITRRKSILIRKCWESSPFILFQSLTAAQIQQWLGVGSIAELRWFLKSLLRDFFPWIPSNGGTGFVEDASGTLLALEVLFWSRMIGQAKVLRIGERNRLSESVTWNPIGWSTNDTSIKISDVIHYSSTHFEGAIYNVSALDFAQHFQTPRDIVLTR